MKTLIAFMAALCATPAAAQTPTPAPAGAPAPATTITGSVTSGALVVSNASKSAKFTEYRDLRDNFSIPKLSFGATESPSGWFFELNGQYVGRADQRIVAVAGRPGAVNFGVVWNEIPHNYSTAAVTPYVHAGDGRLTVPATVPITYKKLATGPADTAGVLASDNLVAAYQAEYLRPVNLSTQTDHGRFTFDWNESDAINLSVAYDRREKTGSKGGFGPVGDRPPRTLNIQLAEPVDYLTNDVTVAAEHDGGAYQVRGEFLYSNFANQIDTLRWENVWTSAAPGADYDTWDRLVATVGARPLPPDNTYQNALVSGGVNLPADSRLSATVSFGQFNQNEPLLPYASHSGAANQTLARSTADASITTTSVNADYVVNPTPRVNLRAFVRYYDLGNDTPEGRWQYVTSDTTNTNGTVAYVNKRISVPHAWDRNTLGAEAIVRLPARSALTLGYAHEAQNYAHREADTNEHVFRAGLRIRPASWMTLRARYHAGLRTGTEYENEVTHEGYWYLPSEATDNNNPALTFDNHPDMRRFDVIDRNRQQFDVTVNLTPREALALSAYARYRSDDYDADVQPSQPLAGTGLAEQNATSPGSQLGFLEDARLRYGADLFFQANPRVSFNAFIGYDQGTKFERSLEFNENNKANPSAVATAELGPWTRAGSQWTADFDDRTWSSGFGAVLQLVPDRLTLTADYTMSRASVDITYAGYGVTNWDGTPYPPNHQFAFTTPPTTKEDLHAFSLRFEIPVRMFSAIIGYSFESYTLEDWQEGGVGHWVEPVGAETLLRDSSRSFQWGNRLFNLGTYLAPSYDAHVGFIGMLYRF
jgi:MtrB/PioB family decaheme-associated outer membrane protein